MHTSAKQKPHPPFVRIFRKPRGALRMLELQIFFLFFLDRPSQALAPSPEAAYILFKETCGVEIGWKETE